MKKLSKLLDRLQRVDLITIDEKELGAVHGGAKPEPTSISGGEADDCGGSSSVVIMKQ